MFRPMFEGFPPEALTFFRGLARNNHREWFLPRKELFDTSVKTPMLGLAEAINAEFARFAPDYITDPKKAVYRIYRDVRFSADKSPYKTHLAAIFPRRTGSKGSVPGFYLSISAKEIGVAGGIYEPSPEHLLALRTWLAENHEAFRKGVRGPEKLMGKLQGESLRRVPKGFAADHPASDLIKMKRWLFHQTLAPELATSPKLLGELVKRFKAILPVLEMLNQPLERVRPRAVEARMR